MPATAPTRSAPPLDASPARAASHALCRPGWTQWLALGLLLGTLDLAFATAFGMLRDSLPPLRVAQSIAGWVVGRDAALAGGPATAALGVGVYAAVTAAVVAGYQALVALDDGWRRHPRVGGLAYGLAAYVIVFEVAVPLGSAAPVAALPLDWRLACACAYACLVGVPSALAARAAGHGLAPSTRTGLALPPGRRSA